jgi:DNA repair protein RecN (Recombination protein N)
VLCDNLPDLLFEMQDKLASLHADDQALERLEAELQTSEAVYQSAAQHLTVKRQDAAKILSKAIMRELPDLKLGNAVFRVRVDPLEKPSKDGVDDVCFLIQTNAGSPEGELGKVASGGELSRIMLALKVVLSDSSPVPVMVFDEVDSGIGGSTADAVGARLARMAKDAQILVVTHSPQVAAKADHHWIISKADDKNGMTQTSVNPIEDEIARVDEIARMVSGASLTDEARAAARVLRNAA